MLTRAKAAEIAEMTAMAERLRSNASFHDLPGELKNEIYELVLDEAWPVHFPAANAVLPINHNQITYTSSPKIHGIFLASREISAEFRGLFYAKYFSRRHYILRSRNSLYFFSQLPTPWTQNLHQVFLTSQDIVRGRKNINSIRVALVKAAKAGRDSTDPSTRFEVCSQNLSQQPIPEQKRILRCAYTARYTLGGLPITLRVCRYDLETFEVRLIAPLGKLDWTFNRMMQHTEDALTARRAAMLHNDASQAPVRQLPANAWPVLPYDDYQGPEHVVSEFAVELKRGLRER